MSFTSPTDGWAVGWTDYTNYLAQALIEHWDGVAWTVIPSPNSGQQVTLNGVKAYAGGAIAVGLTDTSTGGQLQTLVERWNGTAWTVVPSPNVASVSNSLYGVTLIPNSRQVVTVGYSASTGISADQTLIESNCQ